MANQKFLLMVAAATLLGAFAEAQHPSARRRPQHHPARDDDGITSITQLATPYELRTHGTEGINGSVGAAGITVTNVGQADDSVAGLSGYNLWEVSISAAFTGSGFGDRFYFVEPIPRPTTPVPLLVFNHRFGKTNLDIAVSTNYLKLATERGWYIVAPTAASNKHFLSIPAQLNTEFILDWVTNLPQSMVDMSRIYGIGFSMGGGMVMSYGARHVDPTRPMYAAIVNHTGDVSLNHVYDNETPQGQAVLDFWYGDFTPGSADPLAMQRSSLIDYDPDGGEFLTESDMVRNLSYAPLMVVRASDDLIDYLEVQTDALDFHIQTVLGIAPGPNYHYQIYPYNGHAWDMLPEATALDFLQQHTLQLPTSGSVLADRNARWFYFTTTLKNFAANAEFDWEVDALANRLSFSGTLNLSALTVDTLAAGLDPLSPLTLEIASGDGAAVAFFLRDYAAPPSQVLLDGQPTSSWVLVEDILRFEPPDGAAHTLLFIP